MHGKRLQLNVHTFQISPKKDKVLVHLFQEVIHVVEGQQCRDRFGFLPPASFNLRSCGMCFTFLYQQENKVQAPLVPYGINLEYLFVPQQNSSTGKSGKYTVIEPNCNNETSRNQICKWCSCCMSASACCERQLRMPLRQEVKSDYNQCPRTWDGYSCWDDSPPATTVHNRCPPFISSRFVDYSSKLLWAIHLEHGWK